VRRAYLGVASQAVRLDATAAGQDSGLLIVNVEGDSPAGRAGLLVGDVLIGIEGTPTLHAEDLQGQLGPERVGAAVTLSLLRGGAPHEVTATLAERA
jgi:S1-C subfamily serine protease